MLDWRVRWDFGLKVGSGKEIVWAGFFVVGDYHVHPLPLEIYGIIGI
jgi:hypothetical protein